MKKQVKDFRGKMLKKYTNIGAIYTVPSVRLMSVFYESMYSLFVGSPRKKIIFTNFD